MSGIIFLYKSQVAFLHGKFINILSFMSNTTGYIQNFNWNTKKFHVLFFSKTFTLCNKEMDQRISFSVILRTCQTPLNRVRFRYSIPYNSHCHFIQCSIAGRTWPQLISNSIAFLTFCSNSGNSLRSSEKILTPFLTTFLTSFLVDTTSKTLVNIWIDHFQNSIFHWVLKIIDSYWSWIF